MTRTFDVDALFEIYKHSGLLTRTTDGQTPTTPELVLDAIGKIEINTGPSNPTYALADMLQNQAPPYSSSLLYGTSDKKGAGVNAPVLWYNYNYSEAFPKKSKPNRMGKRTVIAAVFANNAVNIAGGFVWDADSNLRNLGNIPATQARNRSSPTNLYPQMGVFNGVGDFRYSAPESLNNHPFYNPLFYPKSARTGANGSPTTTEEEVTAYLREMGRYKSTWLARLKASAGGFDEQFANYINATYQTGVEPEILIAPKAEARAHNQLKFNLSAIRCLAFFTDGQKHDSHSLETYQAKAAGFLKEATEANGWINREKDRLPPLVSVTGVALPSVPLSGTAAANGNIGKEWSSYLNTGYDEPLKRKNFKLIQK